MNLKQLLAGSAALGLGFLMYLSDRCPGSTYFVNEFFESLSINAQYPDLFGCLDRSLASFLHVFGFILITAGVAAQTLKGCLTASFFWGVLNILFETGQYFDDFVIKYIPAWFERFLILETVDDFFLSGSFDPFDITATVVGAATGYFISIWTLDRTTGRKTWRSAF